MSLRKQRGIDWISTNAMEKHVKRKLIFAVPFLVLTCAISAQGADGSGNGGTGSGHAHGAATAGPTTGGEPASGAMSGKHIKHHKSKKAPATDSTNMPGVPILKGNDEAIRHAEPPWSRLARYAGEAQDFTLDSC